MVRNIQRIFWVLAFGIPPALMVVSEYIRIGVARNNLLFAISVVSLFGNYVVAVGRLLKGQSKMRSVLILSFVRAPLVLIGWLLYVLAVVVIGSQIYGLSDEVFD